MKSLFRKLFDTHSYVPSSARLILVSHDISSPSDATYSKGNSTPPELFERQLSFLQEKFQFVSLPELLRSESPEPLAALTFDDGFLTVKTRAASILSARLIPFSIFCNGKAVAEQRLDYGSEYEPLDFSRTRFYLNESELKELHKNGVGIGSHGLTHQPLGSLGAESLKQEIAENKRYLENLLGSAVTNFAFPFGKPRHISEAAIRVCQEAGHSRLFSALPSYVPRNKLELPETLIPRVSLHMQSEADLNVLLNRMAIKEVAGI